MLTVWPPARGRASVVLRRLSVSLSQCRASALASVRPRRAYPSASGAWPRIATIPAPTRQLSFSASWGPRRKNRAIREACARSFLTRFSLRALRCPFPYISSILRCFCVPGACIFPSGAHPRLNMAGRKLLCAIYNISMCTPTLGRPHVSPYRLVCYLRSKKVCSNVHVFPLNFTGFPL